jgi:penicillin-binding protein 2
VLSLDIKLQKMVEELYGNRRGALVAIDPRNGEVLAMVSKPTYDLNLFVDGIDTENWAMLNESIDRPLLNRALRGTYPPGSTYKPFMAIAGWKAASARRTPPSWTTAAGRLAATPSAPATRTARPICAAPSSSRPMCTTTCWPTTWAWMPSTTGWRPGLWPADGIDLKGEVRGVLPNQEWKRNTYKRPEQKKWFAGETISLGIGQGYNNFTILQLANAMATLANHGVKNKPQLGWGGWTR